MSLPLSFLIADGVNAGIGDYSLVNQNIGLDTGQSNDHNALVLGSSELGFI